MATIGTGSAVTEDQEFVFQAVTNGTGLSMGLETTWQAGNNLLYYGDLSQIDIADIGFSAFSKYGFVGMALVDYTSSGNFSMLGYGKNSFQFGTDLLIGGFNRWQVGAMGGAGIERSVINYFNQFNSNLRSTVGTGIKEGMKDE
jgi:hypothetical protein